MILYGTIVNVAGVLCGGLIGLGVHKLLRKGIPQRYSQRIMQGIGLCTIYIAAGSLLGGSKTLVTILSMVIGAVIGELLDLDGKINSVGEKLEKRFGGSGILNVPMHSHKKPMHGFEQSISVNVPPMSVVLLRVPAQRAKKAGDAKGAAKKAGAPKAAKTAKAEAKTAKAAKTAGKTAQKRAKKQP